MSKKIPIASVMSTEDIYDDFIEYTLTAYEEEPGYTIEYRAASLKSDGHFSREIFHDLYLHNATEKACDYVNSIGLNSLGSSLKTEIEKKT